MTQTHPPIEDYAYLADGRSGALVSSKGSIDWLCFPRFDSPSTFARLLGDANNGHWTLGPVDASASTKRWYIEDSLVLCTEHTTASGTVRVTDSMAIADDADAPHRVVRVVEGQSGVVEMNTEIRVRFDYGSIMPWVQNTERGFTAVGGPDAVEFDADIKMTSEDFVTHADFSVAAGERIGFVLTWSPSHDEYPARADAVALLDETTNWWQQWSQHINYSGAYAAEAKSSLITLKGLSHRHTGGFVAAATTSLPEWIGGHRNWDYRYTWLRDASFTLGALLTTGCTNEATKFRDWLVRSLAGDPEKVQIMYGLAGERRLPEAELPWLSGYQNSPPVRIGNGAWDQLQIDIYGEVADALHIAQQAGMEADSESWQVQTAMLEWLEGNWDTPDDGIWESRGERARHTYSQVMAWVAFDRAARTNLGIEGTVDKDRWRAAAHRVHTSVTDNGLRSDGVFTQSFGEDPLDASALLIPVVGFLPPDDERVIATINAIDRELTNDGLVNRYSVDRSDDGVGGEEGTFLLCSFWMVEALAVSGRKAEATELYERLLSLRNDVGLLAEEYDPIAKRHLGNFPQAFSHVGMVNGATALCEHSVSHSEMRRAQ